MLTRTVYATDQAAERKRSKAEAIIQLLLSLVAAFDAFLTPFLPCAFAIGYSQSLSQKNSYCQGLQLLNSTA